MGFKYILILIAIVFSAIAQSALKKGAFYTLQETEIYYFVGAGAILYIIVFFLQVYLLRFFDVSKLTPVLTIGSMILIVGLAMWLFQETVSIKQGAGILLGAVSIYLILS